MNSIIAFAQQHPYIFSASVTYGTSYVITVLVTNMEAPTAQSTSRYRYWFKVLNAFAGALARAANSRVERSPNFEAAVAIQTGQTPKTP